jgi:hypothetical protein
MNIYELSDFIENSIDEYDSEDDTIDPEENDVEEYEEELDDELDQEEALAFNRTF